MSPKCPQCGYQPPKGRPKKLKDSHVRFKRERGWSLAKIAKHYDVTRGAIQASLKRAEKVEK